MTLPDDKRRRTARDRFRNILSAEQEDESAAEMRKPPVVNLPKVGVLAPEQMPESASTPEARRPFPVALSASRYLPTFWTVGGVLSVIANLVLLMMLISAWRGMGALNPAGSGGGALLGLYASLEQMDQAHIRTTIPVQTDLALDASVPVKTSTNITLARDARIQGAHVTIDTALFNIDAPASITLPAGTSLDVALDMTLPLQSNIPIAVELPVDIAVRDTELHAAIRGLQDSLRPLLCAASPGAALPDGAPVCR
ncbi:MAG: hypothetical protein V1755_14215 [Chloroflexota bacterium]